MNKKEKDCPMMIRSSLGSPFYMDFSRVHVDVSLFL